MRRKSVLYHVIVDTELQVIAVVVLKCVIFWDIMPSSSVKVVKPDFNA
jgi:hypothetical protein